MDNFVDYYTELKIVEDSKKYCIVGQSLAGGRYLSEMLSYEEALAEMPKYTAVVDYFGGGTVDLYDWNGDIIKTKVAMTIDYKNFL